MAKVDSGAFHVDGRDYRYVVIDGSVDADLPGLTRAESEVARLVCAGCSNREIARRRRTSENTVGNQLASVFGKLGVTSRYELVERVTRMVRDHISRARTET